MGTFRKEDITFYGARRQNQILNEIPKENIENAEPDAPSSTTPEQVIRYLEECIAVTDDKQKKHVFNVIIKWIKEYEKMKQDSVAEKVKAIAKSKAENIEAEEVE